jgi:branched-subunit amino acid transport protein
MIQTDYLFIVIGMGFVTYIHRWLPLLYLSRRGLPEWFAEWLDFIPAAILSALIFPLLVTTGEPRHLDLLRSELFVAIPTLIVAIKTRSLAGTVIFGMVLYWIAGKFI